VVTCARPVFGLIILFYSLSVGPLAYMHSLSLLPVCDAPSDAYFSKKLQHLSEVLTLTEAQQDEIRPTFEQETGEVEQTCPQSCAFPRGKADGYKKIVRSSDEKINPLLWAPQLQKLLDLRQEQKRGLEGIIAKQKSEQN
jgi:hypothetical protein